MEVFTCALNHYSKTCVKQPLSKRTKNCFSRLINYRLMLVKSIAECSKGSILQYVRPSFSYNLSLTFVLSIFEWPFYTGFTAFKQVWYTAIQWDYRSNYWSEQASTLTPQPRGLISVIVMLLCAYQYVINNTISMRNVNWLHWNGWQCKAHSQCQNDWLKL